MIVKLDKVPTSVQEVIDHAMRSSHLPFFTSLYQGDTINLAYGKSERILESGVDEVLNETIRALASIRSTYDFAVVSLVDQAFDDKKLDFVSEHILVVLSGKHLEATIRIIRGSEIRERILSFDQVLKKG